MTSQTRNRFDCLAALQQLEAEIPAGQRVIAILDDLATHKNQEVQDWLNEHPRWDSCPPSNTPPG